MNDTKALSLRGDIDLMTLGDVMVQSGFFQDSRQAAQAVVKILAGRELGFGPIASMTGVNVIKGRVTLSANLIAAAIKRSGRYNYRVTKQDDKGCTVEFFEGGQSIGQSTFDEADAKAAGLAAGDNWRKYPRNMYFARAISNGAKWFCPDIFGGPVYTPDEMGAVEDQETGAVVMPEVAPVDPPAPTPAPQSAPTRNGKAAGLVTRIKELVKELEFNGDCLTVDQAFLDTADVESLTDFGKNLRARLETVKAQNAAMADPDDPEPAN